MNHVRKGGLCLSLKGRLAVVAFLCFKGVGLGNGKGTGYIRCGLYPAFKYYAKRSPPEQPLGGSCPGIQMHKAFGMVTVSHSEGATLPSLSAGVGAPRRALAPTLSL